MPDISNYLQRKILNTLSGKSLITSDMLVRYVGLLLTPGGQYYAGREPRDAAYARQIITLSDPVKSTDAPGYMEVTNTEDIIFPAAEASWGSIKYFGLFSSASASANLLFSGELKEQVNVNRWDTVVIPAGSLSIQVG